MKKIPFLIMICLFAAAVMVWTGLGPQGEIPSLIRFHVIANSDSDDDQQVKIKARDALLGELSPALKIALTGRKPPIISANIKKILKRQPKKSWHKKYTITARPQSCPTRNSLPNPTVI